MRIRCVAIGILGVLVAPAAPALAANQTVSANGANQFVAKHVGVNVGETVTWNNSSGFHNVHFDDNSYTMPASPSGSAWSVQRTFNTPGVHRYYCEVHGGPNGAGMSGTVAVNTGYPRPTGASPLRTSLVVAYKPCTAANAQHGTPLASSSCNPPVQESDWLTVGTPDANQRVANSTGFVRLTTLPGNLNTEPDEADVRLETSITDVRRKSDLTDYAGQLQVRLALRLTDRYNGPSLTQPGTAGTTFNFTIPCAATPGDATIGSTCSATTTADAVLPGAVLEGRRSIWDSGKAQVFDGGSDGVVSTSPNTLFADQGLFIP